MRTSSLPFFILCTLGLWLSPPPAQACDAPLTAPQFDLAMEDAEGAFRRLDLDAYLQVTDTLAERVPCVQSPLSRAEIARYHRVEGLRGFLLRDPTRSRAAFAAARRLEPEYRLPADLVPEDHPIRIDYSYFPLGAVTTSPISPPAGSTLWVDGQEGDPLPANIPTLLQLRDGSGEVQHTYYLWPEEPRPAWPATGTAAHPKRPRVLLLSGAAVGGLVAGGLAWRAEQLAQDEYWDPETPTSALDGLRGRVNALDGAAIGVGALAVGAGVLAFTVEW